MQPVVLSSRRRPDVRLCVIGLACCLGVLPGHVAHAADPTVRGPMTDRPGPLSPKPVQVSGAEEPVVYQDPSAPLDFTFEYPRNWVTGVDRGSREPYWQVVILGPRNEADSYSASLTVRLLPNPSVGGKFADLEALVEGRKRQYGRQPGFLVLSEDQRDVAGVAAQEWMYRLSIPLPSHSTSARPTAIQTHEVRLAVRGHLYELIYTADQQDFDAYHRVFLHLLDSLTLR